MKQHLRLLLVCLAIYIACPSRALPNELDSPLSPAESIEHFRLAPGLEIEPAASEPQVVDPVAIRFDERGRMWVVEMRDYPHGPADGEPPTSRIVILEDRDGDGAFEHATVFADRLLFATGIQPWQGGVFVTMAGEVAYMKDTDNDGKCDLRETWYTGFAQENSQLRANHPRLALDNQIYLANGLRGGAVVDARDPQAQPLSISGMDFRFDPHTREFEAVSGVGQFGLTFDDYGNRFVCSNRNPLKHIVLENRDLKRNPLARITTVFHDVAKAGTESRIYPISRAWTTSNLHAGQFTAACGVTIYRGRALPDEFFGNGFTCDPTGNLVHREVLRRAGPTFDAAAARDGVEFLASPDLWFRPVNLEVGPDGALYVVDMYRAVIEHPQFMPTELKSRPDLLLGRDRGRIYRIHGTAVGPHKPVNLAETGSLTLIGLLGDRDAWIRETAARLLLERRDSSVRDKLITVARASDSPLAQVHALWLLQGLGLLEPKNVVSALSSSDADVRRQGVKLAAAWMDQEDVRESVRKLADDDECQVRFQVALSLAPAHSQADEEALWKIMRQDISDLWIRRAITIASGARADELVLRLLNQAETPGVDREDFVPCLADLVPVAAASESRKDAAEFLRRMVSVPRPSERLQLSALLAFERSMRQRGIATRSLVAVADTAFSDNLARIGALAEKRAVDVNAANELRYDAIELLGYQNKTDTLIQLTDPAQSQPIRIKAIQALAGTPEVDAWNKLLASFPSESPAIRREIVAAVLQNENRTVHLLDEISSGRIKASEIDVNTAARLLKHRDAAIRDRATKLFDVAADRKQVLRDYQAVLAMKAVPERGRDVFQRNCASCHRIGELGVDIAPDISDSRTKQPAQLLADILQPNRAIDNNYLAYTVISREGRVFSGILTSETATSITLQQPEGKIDTLLRDEIDVIRSTGMSLMPEGLEKNIPHQAMADLISFIKNWRYLDGRTPF